MDWYEKIFGGACELRAQAKHLNMILETSEWNARREWEDHYEDIEDYNVWLDELESRNPNL